MARKIKFPLEMGSGCKVRSIEELRENFDLELILKYIVDGKLLNWLSDRGYEEECLKIKSLEKSADSFSREVCNILKVEFAGRFISMSEIEEKNKRLTKLKEYCSNDDILKNIDIIAFSDEELVELIKDNEDIIYLFGETFNIPLNINNKKIIGINNPVVVIDSTEVIDFKMKKIEFKNVIIDEKYSALLEKIEKESFKYIPSEVLEDSINDKDSIICKSYFNIIREHLNGKKFDIKQYGNEYLRIIENSSIYSRFNIDRY